MTGLHGGRRAATRPRADGPELLGWLADAVPHLVWVAGSDGVVREYSGRIAGYRGPRNAADDGWTWEWMVHPDDLEDTLAAWTAAVAAGATYEHEHRLQMADGEYRWHLSRGVPRSSQDGGETLWYGTATDIHDVRDAEERLRRIQSALALAMRGGQIGWWQRDLTTEEVTWSPELEELFGLPPGSFSGDRYMFLDFVHPDDREAIDRAVARAIETGDDYVIEFRFQHTDGTWRWMEGRGRATYEAGRPIFLHGIGMDITGRKETEATIRASEERVRLAAEVGGFGLYDYDLEHGGMYWSPELHVILGTDGEAAAPEKAAIHPDDRDGTLERFAAAQAPESDGTFDHEYRMVRPDGTVRWVSTHGQTYFSHPRPDPRRRALRSIGVVVDITERKQADDLRDVFVGMLSHELRTPVTSIYGGSQVLRRGHVDEATRSEIIDDIITESERLERLVENLLVLARAERHASLGGRDPVLLRPLLTRVIEEKRRRFPTAVIEVDIEPGLPPVTSDDASVELVLRNLVSNAIKYGPVGGTVTVTCRRDGDLVALSVADEGPGIPVEDPARIFELFYRTDEARLRAQGAGIGLFVVRVLVEGSGGRVSAVNRPGGGSEFSFSLPVFVESDDGPAVD
ncbi:MAG TPA: PAS domain-containing protein [Candidatus Limnocylindrales bacterium]|nr:PAS domain-containing protein [Candidatus Limnocylindrales bacterium]